MYAKKDHAETLRDGLYNLLENGVELNQAQITLSTKNITNKKIRDLTRIDTNVGAAMSPYLHSMLTGGMKESSSESVELDLTTIGIRCVVKFMYTGTLELANVSAALNVIAVADYLMMDSVKTATAQYLMAEMNPTNALQMIKEAALYSKDVTDIVSNYIDVHFAEIHTKSNDWYTLTPGEIQYWLSRDTLLVQNEDEVYEALGRWTAYDIKARTKVFKSLMLDGTIRVPYISNEKLAKIREHKFSKSITKDLDAEAWRRMAAGGFEAAHVGLDVLPRCHSVAREPVCPLTLKPFRTAVVAPCGHRFEKHAFECIHPKQHQYTSNRRSSNNTCSMLGCRIKYTAKKVRYDVEFQKKCDTLRAKHKTNSQDVVAGTTSGTVAVERLNAEFDTWSKNPLPGFLVSPQPADESNLITWKAGIPGKKGTPWEGGFYKLELVFTEEYPSKEPLAKFTPVLFHPNVYPSGRICLNILFAENRWQPTLTIKQILLGVQAMLENYNNADPSQREPYQMISRSVGEYKAKVRSEVRKHPIQLLL